jgi:hypothetical protein
MTSLTAKRTSVGLVVLGVLVGFGLVSIQACSRSSPSGADITIVLTNAPATLTASQSVILTANVYNDTANSGVDWSCATSGSCGSFNPAHTASGGKTVYTAPSSLGTVTVTATSTANTAVKANATISIVPVGSNSMLNGTYVFQVQGVDSGGGYVALGTIAADGNGNITSGEQDYADQTIQAGPDAVTGSYSIGPDGRGSLTLNVSDLALPDNGVETFSFAVTSTAHALIIQFDGSATSSGTLDFQPVGAALASSINGAYAFTSSGEDISAQVPMACGGIATLNASAGTLTNGLLFENDGGTTSSIYFTGMVTGPDTFGRGTIQTAGGFHFVYYLVQGEVLRLVQEDAPTYLTGGTMYGQAGAGMTPAFSDTSLTGDYVFFDAGAATLGSLALVGQFATNGNGAFTAGFVDVNEGGSVSSGSFASLSNYAIASDGSGTFTLPGSAGVTQEVSSLMIFATDPNINLLDPNNPSGGGGALILDFDTEAAGTGLIVPQSAGTVTGNYAVNLQFVSSGSEYDLVGQSVSNGSGSLTGTVDVNANGAPSSNLAFAGTYAADPSNSGRFTGTFTIGSNAILITYYQVSNGVLLIIDTDTTDVGFGIMETQ